MEENKKELLSNITPFGLRMQPDLRERVKASAEKNNRSMNAEIVKLIEEGYDQRAHVEWANDQYRSAQEEHDFASAMQQHDQELQDEFEREQSNASVIKEMRDEMARIGEALAIISKQLPAPTTEDIFQAIRDIKSKATKDDK